MLRGICGLERGILKGEKDNYILRAL